MEYDYDLVVIGSGPGGYVAAIRAGQTGLKTAIIEKNKVGGMCLNWGCIPTKTLMESAKALQRVKDAAQFGVDGVDVAALSFNWKNALKRVTKIVRRLSKGVEFLLKKNGVQLITGTASLTHDGGVRVENRLIRARHIILATGSRPKPLPAVIPAEIACGIPELLERDQLPDNPVIMGNGPHAVELAQFFNLIGKNVTLISETETLMPDLDPFFAIQVMERFKKEKLNVLLNGKVEAYADGRLKIAGFSKEDDYVLTDCLINALPREAVLPEMEAPLAGALPLRDGFVVVDDHMRTPVENIFAVGDMNGRSMFAHAASAQGLHVVNLINGISAQPDFGKLPVNIYTYPEMAGIGKTTAQLAAENIEYKINEFGMTANGKALAEGNTDGLVRLISDLKYGEVLGVQIIAPHATDMIAEASVLMQLEGTIYDVAQTVHAHPTVSEIFLEAGFDAVEQPIHK